MAVFKGFIEAWGGYNLDNYGEEIEKHQPLIQIVWVTCDEDCPDKPF
jgi:hypothetical protein